MRGLISVSAALLLVLSSAEALAGAWTRPQWGFYLRLDNKYYRALEIFDAEGDRVAGDWWDERALFEELSSSLVAELGVLDQLTVLFEGSGRIMHSDYSRGAGGHVRVAGFSDVSLGLRYGPYQRRLVTAIEARVEIPTGYPRDEDRVRLGSGYVNGLFRVGFGGGLPIGIGSYFDLGFGYRLRGGPPADDLVASAAVGLEAYDGLWIRGGFSGTFNLGDPEQSTLGNQDASYLSVGGAVTYILPEGFGIEVAASGEVWGRNTFAGWGLSLVLQYEG